MNSTANFPLPLLPTIADDLDAMDSRLAIRYINTFMKNALIRGLNNVYDLAVVVEVTQPTFSSFLDYILVVCDMLCLHIEGDESFFTTPNQHGIALLDVLGTHSNMNLDDVVYKALKVLQQRIYSWKETPSAYAAGLLRFALRKFAHIMLPKMRSQVDSMNADALVKAITDKDLREMIQENLQWLATHSDITYLLPFVLSHHDPKTSAHWPSVSPEGLQVIPELVEVHAACWPFAPIDPVTREAKTGRLI